MKLSEEQFDNLVHDRTVMIKRTLVEKGKEYRRNNDPLHNFRIAAKVQNTTEEKALWGFAVKHYVSFLDILNDIEKGILPKEEVVNEKIGDLINYLILCEASIKEKIQTKKENMTQSFDVAKYKELLSYYNEAVKENKEQFTFYGEVILTSYAKYLLEYLKPKFDESSN